MSLPAIKVDPAICGGQPCVRGTRVTVAQILRDLTHSTPAAIAAAYEIQPRQVIAAAEYAARLCEEQP